MRPDRRIPPLLVRIGAENAADEVVELAVAVRELFVFVLLVVLARAVDVSIHR